MKKLFGLLLIVTSLGMCAFTCEEDEPNDGEIVTVSPVESTTLPATGKVNTKITFQVAHTGSNGCARYAHQKSVVSGKDVYVTFFNKYPKEAFCTMNVPILYTDYSFTPELTGEYTFHFKRFEGDFLVQKITISE